MMGDLLRMVIASGSVGIMVGLISAYVRAVARADDVPKREIDPYESEARRLARQEIEELDWRLGTGPKPEHLIRADYAKASRELDAATERPIFPRPRKHIRMLKEPTCRVWEPGELPDLPVEGVDFEVKNCLGEVVYRYRR